jgi:glutamyl-tRNA synthetase/nondiscriminating glutamyl-tRNA synthetase
MTRVRFAPSPTGYLHIGASRTALFNWLFARHHKGKFILRIEDTDTARSSEEMCQGILEGLEWLGLAWDEGPFFQSERIQVYKEKAHKLVGSGEAYHCFCSAEEIQERKRSAPAGGRDWKYDRCCLELSASEKERFEASKKPKAVRFKVPEGRTEFLDSIHGSLSVENQNLEDFVLLRNDGYPTYHLSVVVDDIYQRITHVIRGDDHLSNTPKQIMLYRAFRSPQPEFAHLPLILGPDKKKLSKRHGVTSVLQFKDEGYLQLAVINFLAQMNWMPGDKEGIYALDELVEKFSLKELSKNSPIFNTEKLGWFNSQVLSKMTAEELAPHLKPKFKEQQLWDAAFDKERRNWYLKLIGLLKERARVIEDIIVKAKPFIRDVVEYDPDAVNKYLCDERLESLLLKLKEDFIELKDFQADMIENVLRERAEKENVKAALFIHALRTLVLGEKVSPSLFEVLEVAGRQKTLERMGKLKEALQILDSS